MKNLIFFFFLSLGFPAYSVEPDEMLKDPNLENEAKWILSISMIIGRLEIFTVLVLLSSNFWKN